METGKLIEMGLMELETTQAQEITGGSPTSNSIGEFCGWVVGCATNAAEKLSSMIQGGIEGLAIDKIFRK